MESNLSSSNYEKKVLTRIKNILQHKGISQSELARIATIPQATLSKILNSKAKLTISYLYLICNALNVDPSTITSSEQTSFDEVSSMYDRIYSANQASDTDTFIYNTDRPAFRNYTGEYHFYGYSTISAETSLLHGLFTIHDSASDGRCRISLELYTGQKKQDNTNITKKYSGEMVISIPMSTCYCIMSNTEIGEMFFFAFHHMFSFHKKIACRVALGVSTSSGENRRPIAQRFILSRTPLNIEDPSSDDFQLLQGQLRLNSSDIILPKTVFDALLNDSASISTEQKSFLTNCKKAFEKKNIIL